MTTVGFPRSTLKMSLRSIVTSPPTPFFGRSRGLADALGVDVEPDRLDPEPLCGRDHDPPVAAAEVVEDVSLLDLGQLQHLVDDVLGGGLVGDVRFLLRRPSVALAFPGALLPFLRDSAGAWARLLRPGPPAETDDGIPRGGRGGMSPPGPGRWREATSWGGAWSSPGGPISVAGYGIDGGPLPSAPASLRSALPGLLQSLRFSRGFRTRAGDLQGRLVRLIPRRIGIEPMTPLKDIPARVTPGVANDPRRGCTRPLPPPRIRTSGTTSANAPAAPDGRRRRRRGSPLVRPRSGRPDSNTCRALVRAWSPYAISVKRNWPGGRDSYVNYLGNPGLAPIPSGGCCQQ